MKTQFFAYYRPTPDEFAATFKVCLFVFDTNVLLNLYRYTPESMKNLLSILQAVKSRVWLPHRVAYEYHRNRIDVLLGQLALVGNIESQLDKAYKAVENLGRKSAPFAVNALIEPVQQQLERIKDSLQDKRVAKPDLMYGDPILDALTELFDGAVGGPCSQVQYDEILKAGKGRYEKKIPPGYMDISKDSGDTDQYGDLIIWRQLIEHAKTETRPIILVTDDAKEDWWREVRGEKLGPRIELREEFHAETGGKWFYIYSTEQFLKHAQEHLAATVNPEVFQEAQGIKEQDAEQLEELRQLLERDALDPEGASDEIGKCAEPNCPESVWIVSPFCKKHFEEHSAALSKEEQALLHERLDGVLKTLTYREREIIKLRHGFGDGYCYTRKECGRIFKISSTRVRQIEARAIRKLAHPVRARQLFKFFL